MSVSAVIVAAGSSKRMNNGVDKLSLQIGGRSILAWTISRFEMTEIIDEIIIVTREEEIENVKDLAKEEGFKKISSIVRGGSHRQNSTQNGLKAVSSKTSVVLVHDGARPLIHPSDIKKIAESADKNGAALLAVRSKDTVKEVSRGRVKRTLPRESIWLAQTPQGFRKELLQEAFLSADRDEIIGTDEASLIERMGKEVVIVEGEHNNFKVTVPADVDIVRALLKREEVSV